MPTRGEPFEEPVHEPRVACLARGDVEADVRLASERLVDGVDRGDRFLEHLPRDVVGQSDLMREVEEGARRGPEAFVVAPSHQHFEAVDPLGAEIIFGLERATDSPLANRRSKRVVESRAGEFGALEFGLEQAGDRPVGALGLGDRRLGLLAKRFGSRAVARPKARARDRGGEDFHALDEIRLADPGDHALRASQDLLGVP